MTKIKILLLLFMFGKFVFSQTDLDKLITEKAPNCEDIAFNCTQLIEKYYNLNKYDSAKVILDYWEKKCGLSEPILRTKILFSIKDNEFQEAIYDTTIFDYLLNYKDRLETRQPMETYINYKIYFSFVPIKGAFDNFTIMLAKDLLKQQKDNSIEYLFCRFYSGEPVFLYNEIQKKEKYNNTKLKEYYYRLVNKYINLPEFHLSLFSGIWMPFDNAKLLGNHPLIGLEMGAKTRKTNYNLSGYLKFLQSANEYKIIFNDSIITSNYFFGGYVGFDIERELYKIKSNEFNFSAGIGYDGFSAVKTNTNDECIENDKGKSINSLNLNVGLGYRYNLKNNTYLGFRAKYNFVNYKNQGGTDLSGNTIIFTVIFGGFANDLKNDNLKLLNYIK